MKELELEGNGRPLVVAVSHALRTARRRRGLSQRELARELGVSKSRLARLESDAGPQSLEMVCQVLTATGFRLEVIDVYRSDHGEAVDEPASQDESGRPPNVSLDLCDAGGRHFPAHLKAYSLSYPPTYWFVRNGGWTTAEVFPQWTYERRLAPRVRPGTANPLVPAVALVPMLPSARRDQRQGTESEYG